MTNNNTSHNNEFLRELGIPIITPNTNPLICNPNAVNSLKTEKNVLISHNLMGLNFQIDYTYFLKFQDDKFMMTIISQKREKGVICV